MKLRLSGGKSSEYILSILLTCFCPRYSSASNYACVRSCVEVLHGLAAPIIRTAAPQYAICRQVVVECLHHDQQAHTHTHTHTHMIQCYI